MRRLSNIENRDKAKVLEKEIQQMKDKLFSLKGVLYPNNENAFLKTWTFIRLVNQCIGRFELMAQMFWDMMSDDKDSFAIKNCPRCNELSYFKKLKTTGKCAVCGKVEKLTPQERRRND
ncbi:hypothetical protein LCGC14_0494990 [marine sediment metagenome]|uniref:Uncharacterized protein n=1 Tax=marine sediment metagenome TaxID=412755 RepID=A0A0F9SNW7_9ZZZZ